MLRWRRTVVLAALLLLSGGLVAPAAADRVTATPPEGAVTDLAASGSVVGSVPPGWQAVFQENFDGSSLDESLWDIRKGPGISNAVNSRGAISVGGGELKISTYTDPRDPANPNDDTDYTGEVALGELQRGASFLATYGYIEARIKLQNRSGTRSAFWTLSPTWHKSPFGDPAAAGPEIDIMELFANEPEKVNVGKHWDGFDEDHKRDTGRRTNPTATPIQGNYHVYSLLWTPDGYRGYIDGFEVYHSTEAITYSPEYLILSGYAFKTGSGHGPRPAGGYGPLGSSSNATMTVDYVKTWQRPVSEIPNQTFPANSPVSIPFSVQDYFYSSEARSEPGSVHVSANVVAGSPGAGKSVVPDVNVVVTGNGPDDPNGSFGNGGFESGLSGWTVASGTASTWGTRKHSGSSSLRLPQTGAKVTRTITHLQPNTTYIAGGWYNFDQPDDGSAGAEWGIDVTSGTDPEQVQASVSRTASTIVDNDEWRWTSVVFTTGPNTTQVTLFVDNWVYRTGAADSALSFDDIWVQPLVPPNRTVTVRPALNTTGWATIRLTATNASGALLGTEDFTLTFTRGSTFTNGGFETVPLGAGWNLIDSAAGKGAAVIVDNPFQLDRVLELGNGAGGFAVQNVSHLQPNTSYTLELTGRVSGPVTAGQGLGISINGFSGADPCVTDPSDCQITETAWTRRTIPFTTDASGAIKVNLADWYSANGPSYVDDVKLTTASTTAPLPPVVAPALTALGERHIPSSAPHAIFFNQAGATVTGVASNNPALLPNRNLGYKPSASSGIVSVTPVPDRTGTAEITVSYSDSSGTHQKKIPIHVSDNRLANQGFEEGANGWTDATIATTGQRTGGGALRLNGAVAATQKLTWLPYHTTFVMSGWGRAGARMTLRRNGVNVSTVNWTGTGWSQQRVTFTTSLCPDCSPNGQHTTNELWEVVIQDVNPSDGLAAYVDDLALTYAPAASSIANLSLKVSQTAHGANTRTWVWVGRLPNNAHQTSGVVSFSSSNTTVLPVANLKVLRGSAMHPYAWFVSATSAGVAGNSTVTLTLTDPVTGYRAQRSFLVTVNP